MGRGGGGRGEGGVSKQRRDGLHLSTIKVVSQGRKSRIILIPRFRAGKKKRERKFLCFFFGRGGLGGGSSATTHFNIFILSLNNEKVKTLLLA